MSKIDAARAALNQLYELVDEGKVTEEMIRADLGIYIKDIERSLESVTELVGLLLESY